jgi:phosphate uptake regulator
MLKSLLSIFTGEQPLRQATQHFAEMMLLVETMVVEASAIYWGGKGTPEERTSLYETDVRVNKLERKIRKAIVTQLSSPVLSDVPYGLLLMSLVKDIERIGDYAKNLCDLQPTCRGDAVGDTPRELPDDGVTGELREVAKGVEKLAHEAAGVYDRSDEERAHELTLEGRSIARRCDKLIPAIVAADYTSALAVELALATRFYKRINGHLLNLLSSILMPLDKLDYYDETMLDRD